MANSLGALVVTLGLNAVEFVTGLTKAEFQARKLAQRLDREIAAGAKLAAAGFVIMEGAIIGAAYAVDRLVKQAANFKDIEERTGASAEALASFSVSAQVAGTDMNEVGAAMNRLAKNLTGVDDESKAAGAALGALGLNIKEFKALDPATQMQAIAKALGGFEDSAAKGAIAIALLGKAGAQLLPFFKELESGSGRQAILTQKQIEQADEYADAQKRVIAQLGLYAQVAATTALPAITGLVEASRDFIKELIGIDAQTGKLASDNRIREFAEDAARSIAFVVDAVDGLIRIFQGVGLTAGAAMAQVASAAKLEFGQALQIGREWQADMKALAERPLFSSKLDQTFAKQRSDEAKRRSEDRGFKPPGKVLNFQGAKTGGGTGGQDDSARRFLDQQIKAQESAIRDEQEILRDRERFLQDYYQDDLISIGLYYDERKIATDKALRNTLAAYDEEIALLTAFKNNPANKAADRDKAEADLTEAVIKRGRATQEANNKEYESYRDKNRAIQQYKDSVAELDAQIKLLTGDERAAAEIRFDLQNRSLKAKFTNEGDTQSLANLEAIKKQMLAQVDLNKSAQVYSLTLEGLAVAQARINLAQESGAITSLDAINKRSALAKDYVVILRQQADAQESVVRSLLAGPEQDQAIAKLQRMRLEIDQLAESANELENTFRSSFEDAFASGLTDVITKTKTAREAIKDFEKQIVGMVSRLASQNIAESIFGKSGPLGSAPGLLAGLFGAPGTAVAKQAPAAKLPEQLAGPADTIAAAGGGIVDKVLGMLGLGGNAAPDTALTDLGASAAASSLSIVALDTATVASSASLAAAFATLTAAAASAAAALSSVAASGAGKAVEGAGGLLSSLFGGGGAGDIAGAFIPYGGGLAGGTNYARGGLTLVGERGPELVNMPRGAQVIPNNELSRRGQGNSNIFNINVLPGASRRTADQAAMQLGIEVQRAQARNG